MELVFATNNPHKLEEIKEILNDSIHLKNLADIKCYENIPETGTTLEENAFQKSNYIYSKFHINCFADDTGLEIEALDGEPGVYSARYAGENKNASDNMLKVLEKLKPYENRKARFRTVISLIIEGKEHQFEGIVNGKIEKELSGAKGFGYDPIFTPDGYNKTFAEMDATEKNNISHRALAVQKLVTFINEQSS